MTFFTLCGRGGSFPSQKEWTLDAHKPGYITAIVVVLAIIAVLAVIIFSY